MNPYIVECGLTDQLRAQMGFGGVFVCLFVFLSKNQFIKF